MTATSYEEFLLRKQRVDKPSVIAACGIERSWRVSLECGNASSQTESRSPMRHVQSSRFSVEVPDQGQAHVLLARMLVGGEAARVRDCVRPVFDKGLPQVRRAGSRREAAQLLLSPLPRPVPQPQPQGDDVSEGWTGPHSSTRRGAHARQTSSQGRGSSPHRRGSIEQRSEQPRGIPVAVRACAMPQRIAAEARAAALRTGSFCHQVVEAEA